MAKFVCTLCGRCCMGMGRYVKIVGMMGQNNYAIRHAISGENRYSAASSRFRNEIGKGEENGWCPFLCETDEDGCKKYYCAIFDNAPKFCRDYRCCTARIMDADGVEKGTIRGRRTLVTEDEKLMAIWDSHKEVNDITDEKKWSETIGKLLKEQGYILEKYE